MATPKQQPKPILYRRNDGLNQSPNFLQNPDFVSTTPQSTTNIGKGNKFSQIDICLVDKIIAEEREQNSQSYRSTSASNITSRNRNHQQSESNLSNLPNRQYIDQVYEQLRGQFNNAQKMFPKWLNGQEGVNNQSFDNNEEQDCFEIQEPLQPFKNMKEALKFALLFNQRLIKELQSNLDQKGLLNQQAKLIEDLMANAGNNQEQTTTNQQNYTLKLTQMQSENDRLKSQIEEMRQAHAPKDYIYQMVTKISTLLIQTERGPFKNCAKRDTILDGSLEGLSERSFSNGSDDFRGKDLDLETRKLSTIESALMLSSTGRSNVIEDEEKRSQRTKNKDVFNMPFSSSLSFGKSITDVEQLPQKRQPGVSQLMDQFNEQLIELEARLRKGISLSKDLKIEHIASESARSVKKQQSDNENKLIDLKTELATQKNRVFDLENSHKNEISIKNDQVKLLETELREERSKKEISEGKIQELQKDIEGLLTQYAEENEQLKKELADLRASSNDPTQQKDKETAQQIILLFKNSSCDDPIARIKQLIQNEKLHQKVTDDQDALIQKLSKKVNNQHDNQSLLIEQVLQFFLSLQQNYFKNSQLLQKVTQNVKAAQLSTDVAEQLFIVIEVLIKQLKKNQQKQQKQGMGYQQRMELLELREIASQELLAVGKDAYLEQYLSQLNNLLNQANSF